MNGQVVIVAVDVLLVVDLAKENVMRLAGTNVQVDVKQDVLAYVLVRLVAYNIKIWKMS